MTTNKIYFKTADTKEPTLIYDMAYPSSHKSYFIKSETNQVYREKNYSGEGVFGGKDYFGGSAAACSLNDRFRRCIAVGYQR